MSSLEVSIRNGVLSDREREVLLLAAEGLTDKEIALRLEIGSKTVRTYWDRIRQKLAAASRTQALAISLKLAYDELSRREDCWRTIVENLPVLVLGCDDRARIAYCDLEARRALGYEADQLGDENIYARLFPGSEATDLVVGEWSGRNGEYWNRRRAIMCADGKMRSFAWFSQSWTHPVPGWHSWAVGVAADAVADPIESAISLL